MILAPGDATTGEQMERYRALDGKGLTWNR